MYSLIFWKDVSERVVATVAQTILALAGVEMTGWVNLAWNAIFITSFIAGGLALAKSLAASLVGKTVPSLVDYEYDVPKTHAVDSR
jgi:hypothetical protein